MGWALGAGRRRRRFQTWKEGSAPTSGHPMYPPNSVIIPEKLDSFINKFAEYTHEKWAFDKVSAGDLPSPATSIPASLSQDPSFPPDPGLL